MKWIRIMLISFWMAMVLMACHHDGPPTYPNTQTQFADDPSFRLGKWYSITDSGTTIQSHNTNLDTIWFINDTLAGWTQLAGGNPYAFRKTYVDPQSIYNLVLIGTDQVTIGKMDTSIYQFGFTAKGDTLCIYWDLGFAQYALEQYLKVK